MRNCRSASRDWGTARSRGAGGRVRRRGLWGSVPLLLGLFAIGLRPAAADDEPVPPIQPDRPGIADGSTVIFPGRFQIESGLLRQSLESGGIEQHAWFVPTLLRVGINQRWEARVETNGLSRQS